MSAPFGRSFHGQGQVLVKNRDAPPSAACSAPCGGNSPRRDGRDPVHGSFDNPSDPGPENSKMEVIPMANSAMKSQEKLENSRNGVTTKGE